MEVYRKLKYVRMWNCGVCGSAVIYDADSKEIRCNCGELKLDLGRDCKNKHLWSPVKLGVTL